MKKVNMLLAILCISYFTHAQWTTSGNDIYNTNSGNVGIGTSTPQSKIHLVTASLGLNAGDRVNHLTLQNLCGNANNSYVNFYAYRNAAGDSWITTSSRIQQTIDVTPMGFVEFNPPGLLNGLALGTNNQEQLYINAAGQVGIGTSNPGSFKLAVEGKIGAREVHVTSQNPWPDYVFSNQYKLKSLGTLEYYIKKNNRLPDMPSAEEIKSDGLDLGQMNTRVVEKIEELTLYIIKLNKKIEKLEKDNAYLRKQINK
jgi:hypothetical protein